MKIPRVLVVIPAYNEEQNIGNVLTRLQEDVPDFDLLVVNDGSQDNTGEVVESLDVKQLKLVTNLGYGLALQTGIRYALNKDYDVLVTIDADGQHQASDVPTLVEALLGSDAAMVIGSRFGPDRPYNTPITRRIGQVLFSYLTRLLVGYRIYDTSSGLKALRVNACRQIVNSAFLDFHIETIVRLSLLGYRISEMPVIMHEREHGRSMHSVTAIFQYPLKTLLLTVVAAMDVLFERRT